MASTPPPATSTMDLVDLESPPPSPSLSRTKSFALLPKFTFTQESLIPEPLTRKASSSSYNSDKSVSPSQSQQGMKEETNKHGEEEKREEDEDREQDTVISPTALLSPTMSLSSSPMKRDGSGSNSSSGTATSKGSLSAAATPFTFVKKPRQLSIVRKGTPPSFNFDDDHQTAAQDTPTSSIRSHIPYSPSPEQGHTRTLPIYPYQTASPSYGDWNLQLNPYDQTITIQENKQGDVTSPRQSKAIRIVSPLQDYSKAKKSRIDFSSSNDPPPSSFTPTPTKERKDTTTLRERRGKAEILSLYSQSQNKQFKALSSNENDDPSVKVGSHSFSDPKLPSVLDKYSFSFSFPSSSSTPAVNLRSPIQTPMDLLAKATCTPLPVTPTTASSATMDGIRDAQEVSSPLPQQVPLPLSASTMRFGSSLPSTLTNPSFQLDTPQAVSVSLDDESSGIHHNGSQPTDLTKQYIAELDGIEEILQEMEEYTQIDSDRKEAEGLYMGRMEEVMARIKNAAMCHNCLDSSKLRRNLSEGKERISLEEAYRSKLLDLQAENLKLKRDNREYHSVNTTLKERNQVLEVSAKAKQEELDEAYKQYGHYKAEADVIKSKLQELLIQQHQLELDKLHSDKKGAKVVKMYHKAVKEKDTWEEAVDELQQRLDTLKISTSVPESEKPDMDKELPFVAVLLEGHARMFDHKLIQKGEAGGRELASRLNEAVDSVWKQQNPKSSSYTIVVHLFIDVVTVTKQLRTVGAVQDHAQFRSFLDGLTAHSQLSIAQDCPDSEQAYYKMTEYIKLYSHTPNCKIILSGMPEASKYLRFLELLRTGGVRDIINGIQSTKQAQDPLRVLGAGRLVEVPGFFPMEDVEWTRLYQRSRITNVSATSSITSSRAPSVASRASSAMSDHTVLAQSPHHERTGTVYQRSSSSASKSSHVDDPTPIPPWNRPTQSVKHAPPATSDFISIIDRRYNLSPPSSYRNGKSTIRSITSPTPGRNTTAKNKLVVPINPETDNIGGSPPSSDEDEPSVQLPHSAVKHVQRPTTIVQDASDEDDDDAGLPEGFKIRSATNPTRKLSTRIGPPNPTAPPPWERKALTQSPAQAPRTYKDIIGKHIARDERSASISSFSYGSVNSIPLGSRITRRSSISTEPEDRMFIPGPQDLGGHRARRKAEDYMFLSRLDPKPCHHHYLEGLCLNTHCKFAHNISLTLKQHKLLRDLAKEMNCFVVTHGSCTKAESDCIYSHRCPLGRNCNFGSKCWFHDIPGAHD